MNDQPKIELPPPKYEVLQAARWKGKKIDLELLEASRKYWKEGWNENLVRWWISAPGTAFREHLEQREDESVDTFDYEISNLIRLAAHEGSFKTLNELYLEVEREHKAQKGIRLGRSTNESLLEAKKNVADTVLHLIENGDYKGLAKLSRRLSKVIKDKELTLCFTSRSKERNQEEALIKIFLKLLDDLKQLPTKKRLKTELEITLEQKLAASSFSRLLRNCCLHDIPEERRGRKKVAKKKKRNSQLFEDVESCLASS